MMDFVINDPCKRDLSYPLRRGRGFVLDFITDIELMGHIVDFVIKDSDAQVFKGHTQKLEVNNRLNVIASISAEETTKIKGNQVNYEVVLDSTQTLFHGSINVENSITIAPQA